MYDKVLKNRIRLIDRKTERNLKQTNMFFSLSKLKDGNIGNYRYLTA